MIAKYDSNAKFGQNQEDDSSSIESLNCISKFIYALVFEINSFISVNSENNKKHSSRGVTKISGLGFLGPKHVKSKDTIKVLGLKYFFRNWECHAHNLQCSLIPN